MTCPHCLAPLPEPALPVCPTCGRALDPPSLPQTVPPPASELAPLAVASSLVPSVVDVALPPPLPVTVPAPVEAGSKSAPVGPAGTPWERRRALGLLTALVDSVHLALLRPRELFAQTRIGDGLGDPLLFAVSVGYVSLVVGTLYDFVTHIVLGPRFWIEQLGLGHLPGLSAEQLRTQAFFGLCSNVLLGPFFVTIGLFIHAGLVHLALMALGAARRGFEGTWRVTCYAQAASLCVVIPICGILAAIPWTVFITSVGLRDIHATSTGRATLAAAAPLVLACCCLSLVGILIGMLFGAALGAAR